MLQPRILLVIQATLLANVQLLIHQNPQILLFRAALSPFSVQSVFVLEIAPAQVLDLAHSLLELNEIHTVSLLSLSGSQQYFLECKHVLYFPSATQKHRKIKNQSWTVKFMNTFQLFFRRFVWTY